MSKTPAVLVAKVLSVFISISAFFAISSSPVFSEYYQCGSAQCPYTSPEYCCQGGDMVCTGGGCPSYVCNNSTYGHANICGGEWTCCIDSSCTQCNRGYIVPPTSGSSCRYCPTVSSNPPPPSNNPPTAYFSGLGTITGWNVYFKVGQIYNIRAQAQDPNNNLNRMYIYRSPYTNGQAWVELGNKTVGAANCTGTSCILDIAWTPTVAQVGYWHLAVNAHDTPGLKCTGNYQMPQTGWSDCDSTPATYSRDDPGVCVFNCPKNGAAEDVINLVSPTNTQVLATETTATLSWGNAINYGYRCGGAVTPVLNLYYKAGAASPNLSDYTRIGLGTAATSVTLSGLLRNTTYNWFVAAWNGQPDQCQTTSVKWYFRTGCTNICPKSVSAATTTINLISPPSPANNADSVTVTPTFQWEGVNYGSVCSGTMVNTLAFEYKLSTASSFTSITLPANTTSYTIPSALEYGKTYNWRVVASNGVCAPTYSPTWTFTTVYEQASHGWFTALGGNVFAPNIQLYGPANPNAANPFLTTNSSGTATGILSDLNGSLDNGGSLFVSGGIVGFRPHADSLTEQPSASQGDYINSSAMNWNNLDFLANMSRPEGSIVHTLATAAQVSSVRGTLIPGHIYVLNNINAVNEMFSCGTATTCTYNLTGTNPGVALIYYLQGSSETINIPKNFQNSAAATNKRVILITNRPVVISESLETPAATKTSRANIEMGIITSSTITFNKNTPNGSDNTLVVEGPLLSRSGIGFERVSAYNAYPGVAVKFNPLYLVEMSKLASQANLYNSIYTSKVIWEDLN